MLKLTTFWRCAKVRFYSTIYALSSGQGKCGVAVIRVSGPNAAQAILKMTKRSTLPESRKAVLTKILHPSTRHQIDRGLILWFPAPRSFTGEDCCELQVHGGPAVLSATLAALSSLPDYRPADPGEFTRRAFIAGRMDLTAVEGLADLIHAETEQQRRQALLQMEGSLSQLYDRWRTQLLRSVAHVEAYIDFSEDDNIEQNVLDVVRTNLTKLTTEMKQHLEDGRKGERLHSGVRTAILGEPNVGKSSLLNYLVGRAAAIVTPIAGTTRDVVEVSIDIGGYPLLLADTAGQRLMPTDEVEREGIRRAKVWAGTADLALVLHDATQVLQAKDWTSFLENHNRDVGVGENTHVLFVINKVDCLTDQEANNLKNIVGDKAILVSCTTTEGLHHLVANITTKLEILCGNPGREAPSLSQERHRHFITHSLGNIEKGLTLCNEEDCALAAHQFRKGLHNLGQVTGHVTTEDVLDVIFKDFCVGK